eukprot:887869-Rhodomonas_salina.3
MRWRSRSAANVQSIRAFGTQHWLRMHRMNVGLWPRVRPPEMAHGQRRVSRLVRVSVSDTACTTTVKSHSSNANAHQPSAISQPSRSLVLRPCPW